MSVFIPRKVKLGLEKGRNAFNFTLKPYIIKELGKSLDNLAAEILHPSIMQEIGIHEGNFKKEASFVEIPKNQLSISSIKKIHPSIANSERSNSKSSIILRVFADLKHS